MYLQKKLQKILKIWKISLKLYLNTQKVKLNYKIELLKR